METVDVVVVAEEVVAEVPVQPCLGTSEIGACKDLEGYIFTIGSGNKGKDGDMLRTSMEIMATYIVTKYGDFSVYGLVIKHKYHKNNKMFIP